jgi:hypothetical protein
VVAGPGPAAAAIWAEAAEFQDPDMSDSFSRIRPHPVNQFREQEHEKTMN